MPNYLDEEGLTLYDELLEAKVSSMINSMVPSLVPKLYTHHVTVKSSSGNNYTYLIIYSYDSNKINSIIKLAELVPLHLFSPQLNGSVWRFGFVLSKTYDDNSASITIETYSGSSWGHVVIADTTHIIYDDDVSLV